MIFFRLIFQTLFSAFAQMTSNKVRAFLTTLGIIIGVWAITTVIAAVGSLNRFVLDEFNSFGANKLIMWGEVPESKRGLISWDKVKISQSEARALRDRCSNIDRLSLATRFRAPVRYGQKTQGGVIINAGQADIFAIENLELVNGRPFNESDDKEGLQVCIVNDKAIDELLLDNEGLGEHIFINENRFLVIGVIKTKQVSPIFGGGDARSEVYVPYGTMPRLRPDWWPEVRALMKDPDKMEEARAEIRYVMRSQRQLKAGEDDTFGLFIFESVLSQLRAMGATLTAGASVLVGISLLVGGVGIMNIMLVSVSERTREIGLRKAVGAYPAVILIQFLIEAVILCLMGGILGLILGQATVLGLGAIPDFPLKDPEIPSWAVVLAFGFSAGVGVVFGMGPAVKAARLDPIEALRHE
ncbi:MAG: ABC transporter permease [Planctomycetes bacterium]|nr:ABC transporter permease [Planctomycetota bacterium]